MMGVRFAICDSIFRGPFMKPSKKPGIEHEPHVHPQSDPELRPQPGPDPPDDSTGESRRTSPYDPPRVSGAMRNSSHQPNDAPLGFDSTVEHVSENIDETVDRSVWDEPGLGSFAEGTPNDALTYSRWLAARIHTWTQGKAWLMAIGIALLSGPWALLTSLLYFFQMNGNTAGGAIVLCGFVPLVQQISKIAIMLWVIEKRPYFFTGWFQIFFCAIASSVVFVTVLNLIEGMMPIPSPTAEIDWMIAWTVFFAMHLVTSFLSSIGLEKVWRGCITGLKPPKLETGYRWFMAAYLLHVVYAVVYTIFIQVRMFMLIIQ